MVNEVLQELIDFVKGASPVIWEALYKQVYIEAFSMLAWSIGLFVLCLVLLRLGRRSWKSEQEDRMYTYDGSFIFFYVVSAALGFVSFGLLVSSVKWMMNPNFYAIRFVIEKLGS